MDKTRVIIVLEIALILTLAINLFYPINEDNTINTKYTITSREMTEQEKEVLLNADLSKLKEPTKIFNLNLEENN